MDSRQRKKTHTEQLEAEKRLHETRLRDLETENENLSQALLQQEEVFAHQRQAYEFQLRTLVHDRDEAIRAKSLEAAECRRQMIMMREWIREHHAEPSGYETASDINDFTTNFEEFTMDDEWETEINRFPNPEPEAEEEHAQRQATPKPLPVVAKKVEADFSWNTFYMCLLFGAVVISAGDQISKVTSRTDISLPSISDESRLDAGNVLKAVMSSNPQATEVMAPSRSAQASAPVGTAESSHHSIMTMQPRHESNLEAMTTALTAPTREQEIRQAFSMSAATYNQIAHPLAEFDDDADADFTDSPRPSRLDQYMADFDAKKNQMQFGHDEQYAHRSVLADLVPDNVMEEFRAFVHENNIKSEDN